MPRTAPDRPAAIRPATCRMFETPLIEHFSRIHPVTPFVFWMPVVGYLMVRGAGNAGGSTALLLLLAGLFFWTFAEYVLHRYVFHYVGPRFWQRRMHFVIHGVHHDFPHDADRLVMPLGASIPMGATIYVALHVLLGSAFADPLFAGFVLGYLGYDGTHYAIHHFRMSSRWGKWIKRHHMIHHHTGANARWGVSSPLWDWIFGTMGERKTEKAA